MLCARGRFVVSSRYNGARDDLSGCHQGLCRHSSATACVTVCSIDRGPMLTVPFSVWASWAACVDNC